jgi:hypothetical protein
MFEDDINSLTTGEQSQARDATRKLVYEDLYNTAYNYGSSKKTNDFSELDLPLDEDEMPVPLDPAAQSRSMKPFTPTTKFDPDSSKPFGSVLDSPLG